MVMENLWGAGWMMMGVMALVLLLVVAGLILGIAALLKYLHKKQRAVGRTGRVPAARVNAAALTGRQALTALESH